MKNFYKEMRGATPYLKKTHLFFLLFLATGFGFSQTGVNTWMNGSNTADQGGVYGTQGVAAAANTPGGREAPVTWKDATGNLWLFGGYGWDAYGNESLLNDLWKYDISTNEWTWMRGSDAVDPMGSYGTLGVSSNANDPGGREASAGWVDAAGNFWLFGGFSWDNSFNAGEINDLWKYDISTNEWTWMGGSNNCYQSGTYGTMGSPAPSNIPGARYGHAAWFDAAGNLWLHGGQGEDGANNYGDMNDLWKYNISSGQWTWMNGSNAVIQSGVYGTINVSAASNVPGARWLSKSWLDNSGNFWLFGGLGFDANSGSEDILNDLWRYNISTGQWTWMSGSNTNYQSGVYGTMGVPAAANVPGSREAGVGILDAQGNLILFGGAGNDGSGNNDLLNDMWKFDLATNQWTWLNGSNTTDVSGAYGTLGTPSNANFPGSRYISASWQAANNNMWLFGGVGFDASGNVGELNDLWKFVSCGISPTVTIASNTSTVCVGGSATLTASGAVTYSWSNSQTGSVTVVSPANAGLNTISVTPMDVNGCPGSGTVNISILAYALPNATVSVSSQTVCIGSSVTMTATGAASYSWSNNQTTSVSVVTPTNTGVTIMSVTPISTNGCVGAKSVGFVIGYAVPSASLTASSPSFCLGGSTNVTATSTSAATYSWSTNQTGTSNTFSSAVSGVNTLSVYPISGNGCIGAPATVSINVFALPNLLVNSSKPDICMGETVTLNVSGATSYTWTSVSGLNTAAITITPTSTGDYSVTGVDANGCQKTVSITQTVSACTGIAEQRNSGVEYKLYPNPNNGEFIIEGTQFGNSTQLEMYNLLGQKVNVQILTAEQTRVKTELPKGLYTYRVMENDKVLNTGKVVVE